MCQKHLPCLVVLLGLPPRCVFCLLLCVCFFLLQDLVQSTPVCVFITAGPSTGGFGHVQKHFKVLRREPPKL